MKPKFFLTAISLLAVLLLLASCSEKAPEPQPPQPAPQSQPAAQPAEPEQAPAEPEAPPVPPAAPAQKAPEAKPATPPAQPSPPPAAQKTTPAIEPSAPAAQPAEAPPPPAKPAPPAQPPAEAKAPPAPSPQGDADAGKALYAKKCAVCHGEQGEGKPAIAKMLKVELRPLGSKQVQAKPDAELRKDIAEGIGKMKPIKGLSDADLDNLVAFLRTLK